MQRLLATTFILMLVRGASAQAAGSLPVVPKSAAASVTRTIPAGPDGSLVTNVPSGPNELPAGTAIWLKLETPLSTSLNSPGEAFSGRVTRDVTQNGQVFIPVGASLTGKILSVKEGRRARGKAQIRLRPEQIILPSGSRIEIHASIVDTDRSSDTDPTTEGAITSRNHAVRDVAQLTGATAAGAGIGALAGGASGAALGSIIGAGGGATLWLLRKNQAELPAGSQLILELARPLVISGNTGK